MRFSARPRDEGISYYRVKAAQQVGVSSRHGLSPLEQLLGSLREEVWLEAEFCLEFLERCRGPKRIHADNAALQARMPLPSESCVRRGARITTDCYHRRIIHSSFRIGFSESGH